MSGSNFAPVLRGARLGAGVRVNELARRMSCRPSTICRIEAGESVLLESTIVRYARALGFEIELKLVAPPSEEPSTT